MTTTTSTHLTTSEQPVERVAFDRLLWVGPLTIGAATLVNVLLQQIAVVTLRPDLLFLPLTLIPPILFTVVGVFGAVIVFALLGRFARYPITTFKRVAVLVLVISFVPDLLMLLTRFNPGTTLANVLVLMLMHVLAWTISVMMLIRLASD